MTSKSPANDNYAPGDKVRMKFTITSPATEDLPPQLLCNKNEILVVREVHKNFSPRMGRWPIYVSHAHITDRSFGVTPDEIELFLKSSIKPS